MARALGILLAGVTLLSGVSRAAPNDHGGDALSRLLAGNRRYVAGTITHPNQTAGRRRAVANGQHPFAIILGCSDSRVPPEVVFDQGLGDLFVVRVAGNIAEPATLASIEYAAEHIGVGLVVVLGHSRCGAVDAGRGTDTRPARRPPRQCGEGERRARRRTAADVGSSALSPGPGREAPHRRGTLRSG